MTTYNCLRIQCIHNVTPSWLKIRAVVTYIMIQLMRCFDLPSFARQAAVLSWYRRAEPVKSISPNYVSRNHLTNLLRDGSKHSKRIRFHNAYDVAVGRPSATSLITLQRFLLTSEKRRQRFCIFGDAINRWRFVRACLQSTGYSVI